MRRRAEIGYGAYMEVLVEVVAGMICPQMGESSVGLRYMGWV